MDSTKDGGVTDGEETQENKKAPRIPRLTSTVNFQAELLPSLVHRESAYVAGEMLLTQR